jgi:formyltetrahydrofolate hydrolase
MEEAVSFGDPESNKFVDRIANRTDRGARLGGANLRAEVSVVAKRLGMEWQLSDARQRRCIVIAVSRPGHCPNDSLRGLSTGSLDIDVKAVA